jgi:hypothetical protein
MIFSSYLIALFGGLFLYFVMVMDAKYIDPNSKPISPKLPLVVTLMIWLICTFYQGESISIKPQIMTQGFYR